MDTPYLTLISHPLCPFVQRAAIVLHEKGISFNRVYINLADKPDWFLAISPMGKVPLLKVHQSDGSNVVLFESIVICEYAEELQPDHKLHPADVLVRAQHRAWMEFGSTMLADAWGFLTATEAETARLKGASFRMKLERFEQELAGSPYFSGAAFSMVDAIVAPIFRYFDVLDADVGTPWFDGLPEVQTWRSALAQRPSVKLAIDLDYGTLFKSYLQTHGALLASS